MQSFQEHKENNSLHFFFGGGGGGGVNKVYFTFEDSKIEN